MDAYYVAALKRINGIGDVAIQKLLSKIPSGEAIWKLKRDELKALKILNDHAIENFENFINKNQDLPEKIFKSCQKCDAKVIVVNDENYPELLKQIAQPPAMLFYKGTLPHYDDFCIAMVGSRNLTSYGKEAAQMIAEDLASRGVVVVSGAARGIDTASHQGALRRGRTVAVLGCGIDVVYPSENRKLFAEIIEKDGAIISEYPPGTSPYPAFFPARNRIISGLSHGTVVVEAGKKSGALITADLALNEGRDVFAVPGSIFSRMSDGPNNLIKQGAHPVASAEDIIDSFLHAPNIKAYGKQERDENDKAAVNIKKIQKNKPEPPPLPDMTHDEQIVYQLLSEKSSLSNEEIFTSIPPHISLTDLNMILLNLVLKGIVKETDSHQYMRVERS